MVEQEKNKSFEDRLTDMYYRFPSLGWPLSNVISKIKKEKAILKFEKEILALEKERLSLEHDKSDIDYTNSILRTIEFAPEHYQAGMSILSYFITFLNNKYPEKEVKIRIEQDGLIVRMIIETNEGEREIVEEALDCYGLIVLGKMEPEDILDNKIHILELRQQLRLAYMQLENQKELRELTEKQFGQRISTLEEEIVWLRGHVGKLLIHSEKTSKAIILRNTDLIKFFGNVNDVIRAEINALYSKIENGLTKVDEAKIKEIFEKLKREDQSAFMKLILFLKDSVIKGSISGASGHLLYHWIKNFL